MPWNQFVFVTGNVFKVSWPHLKLFHTQHFEYKLLGQYIIVPFSTFISQNSDSLFAHIGVHLPKGIWYSALPASSGPPVRGTMAAVVCCCTESMNIKAASHYTVLSISLLLILYNGTLSLTKRLLKIIRQKGCEHFTLVYQGYTGDSFHIGF